MAKGRKRLIAGWTLLAVAGVMAAGMVASIGNVLAFTRLSSRRFVFANLHDGWISVMIGTNDTDMVNLRQSFTTGRFSRRPQTVTHFRWAISSSDSAVASERSLGGKGWSLGALGYVLDNREVGLPSGRRVQIVFVAWPPIALAATPALVVIASGLRARRRTLRSARGLCPTCGYDLSATPPTFPTCPECGTAR